MSDSSWMEACKNGYKRFRKSAEATIWSDPIFNQSAVDFQDFELPESDFTNLVLKILQYSGVTIRESEIVQAAKSEEIQDAQQKQ